MSSLTLQAKITLQRIYGKFIPFKIKDDKFIVYSNNQIILFDKKLKAKNLIQHDPFCDNDLRNIKKTKNGNILFCNLNSLIYIIISKKIDIKRIEISNVNEYEIILDIIELKNGNIIGITNKSFLDIKLKENENEEIKRLYKISDNLLASLKKVLNYNGHLDIYELPSNRILIHSHFYYSMRKCPKSQPFVRWGNEIFIINLDNFEVIHTDNFPKKTKIIVLNNYFCINHSNTIFIYSIDDYKLLNKISINVKFFNKYDENSIIIIDDNNQIILYDISEINNIKYCIFKYQNFKKYMDLSGASICKLNNKKIALGLYREVFIFEISGKIDFSPFNSIKNNNEEINK